MLRAPQASPCLPWERTILPCHLQTLCWDGRGDNHQGHTETGEPMDTSFPESRAQAISHSGWREGLWWAEGLIVG